MSVRATSSDSGAPDLNTDSFKTRDSVSSLVESPRLRAVMHAACVYMFVAVHPETRGPCKCMRKSNETRSSDATQEAPKYPKEAALY